ncbi:MAG TPA: hypothetical protein VF743_03415 [Acidimicrobiales bacterium]
MADGDHPHPSGDVDELDRMLQDYVEEAGPEGPAAGHAGHEHAGHGGAPPGGHAGHGGPSVRVFHHRGHEVRIVTRYDITIDGEPWRQPLQVLQDGSVAYHGLPQYLVPSAVDLVRAVIDYSLEAPEEIREAVRAARREQGLD